MILLTVGGHKGGFKKEPKAKKKRGKFEAKNRDPAVGSKSNWTRKLHKKGGKGRGELVISHAKREKS